jgi:hypothetical protein
MAKFATIYCLLYGNYLGLQQRLLLSLKKHAPKDEVDIVIWGNELAPVCREQVEMTFPTGTAKAVFASQNTPKYKAMHQMFHDPDFGVMPETPWIVWFDDDSHVVKKDWWKKTRGFIRHRERENVCYFGQPWFVHHLPGQWDFIKQAEWFKGLPPAKVPTKTRAKRPGITFAQGSYWWLRTDVMRQLGWPDPRLNHNGGNTLLAEAIRQQGLPRHEFHYGVKLNDAKRRGFHEAPAGSKNKRVRR